MIVSIASHGTAVLAFTVFDAILTLGGNRQGPAVYLILASALTAAWAGAATIAALSGQARTLPELILETIRSAAWIAFLYRLLVQTAGTETAPSRRLIQILAVVVFLSIIASHILERSNKKAVFFVPKST